MPVLAVINVVWTWSGRGNGGIADLVTVASGYWVTVECTLNSVPNMTKPTSGWGRTFPETHSGRHIRRARKTGLSGGCAPWRKMSLAIYSKQKAKSMGKFSREFSSPAGDYVANKVRNVSKNWSVRIACLLPSRCRSGSQAFRFEIGKVVAGFKDSAVPCGDSVGSALFSRR
jgi:hypothetical protein